MGCGCCKEPAALVMPPPVVQTQNIAATQIPYGYVFIYPGISTPNRAYTCPILSIHTYRQSEERTTVDYAETQLTNKKKFDQQLGSLSAAKHENLSSDETVVMVPIEDVINIYYTCDVKKSVKAEERSHLVPATAETGCFGGCCKKNSRPERRIEFYEQKNAQRVITVHLQYSKYSNLNTVSNVRLLPESERAQFYKDQFHPNTELTFYLVNNNEFEATNFEQKRMHAENLCRIIIQLKGMSGSVLGNNQRPHTAENIEAPVVSISYPSPQELQQMTSQPYFGIFGDIREERLHSVPIQHDPTKQRSTPMQTGVFPPGSPLSTSISDEDITGKF